MSLLHKLGKKPAYEMTDDELQELVARDQQFRTTTRAIGRLEKMLDVTDATEYVPATKVGRQRTKSRVKKQPERLEDFGLPPTLITKMRAGGKPDFQLILELKGAGII